MKQTKTTLKTYFETGDKPTEEQFCDLIDSMITENDLAANSEREFTHTDLQSLVNEKKLVIGQKYILSGYQTKYYIEGTNTSNIEKIITNTGVVTGYGFYDPPLLDIKHGSEVIVMTLPTDYSGAVQVGDTTTVNAYYAGSYLKFANGLQTIIGATFKYSLPRYTSITKDATVIDSNSKIMMQAGGVINTIVHNGEAYMQMTAEENPAVPTEKIVVTAISEAEFSTQAESITHLGELLTYDFTDTQIKNEDGVVLGERMGLITRRISANKKIDINKDWRVQRYRRYKMTDADWQNYLLANSSTDDVYKLGSNNGITAANINITDTHKYVLPYIEEKKFYQDFSKLGTSTNIFLAGTSSPGHIAYGGRMEVDNDDVYKQTVIASAVDNGKDLFIIPFVQPEIGIVSENEKTATATTKPMLIETKLNVVENLDAFIAHNLENTVFLNSNSQYSTTNRIEVSITDGISYSTFSTGCKVFSSSENRTNGLSRITAIDSIILNNKGKIENLHVLTTGKLNNNGDVKFVTIGGMPSNATAFGVTYIDVNFDDACRMRNTMIGGKRVDRMFFSNVQTNKCLFVFSRGQYLRVSDSIMFLTAVKHSGDFYTNNINIDTTGLNANKNKYGFLYEAIPSISGKHVFTNLQGDLVYQVIDGTNNNSTQITTLITAK